MSFRVDNALKRNFDQLCDDFGVSSSAAFTIFMKAVVRELKSVEIAAEIVVNICVDVTILHKVFKMCQTVLKKEVYYDVDDRVDDINHYYAQFVLLNKRTIVDCVFLFHFLLHFRRKSDLFFFLFCEKLFVFFFFSSDRIDFITWFLII